MSKLEMRDIAVDCETLGTRFDAPVLAIAMRAFDRDTGTLGAAFYQEVSLDSAIRSGRVNGSTLAWWMAQPEPARRMFQDNPNKLDLASSLRAMCDFVRSIGVGAPRVWGNGATADITWLEYALAMGSVGLSTPWHFMNIRDMRTIVDAADYYEGDQLPFEGVKHYAPDDATHQAKVISHCWRKIRGPMGLLKPVPVAAKKADKPAVQEDDDL